mmetsp:Transcript_39735/g.123889  ORF Transcript_39735/g.123889 Transcript_39735/m.123889 type:complete len:210 (-) Transcript_39735:224-853(-)
MELMRTKIAKTQATRTTSCQMTADWELVATKWQAFSVSRTAQRVLQTAAASIIRLHHNKQRACPHLDSKPPRYLSKMSGPSATPRRPPRPVLKTKRPKDQALSKPQTLPTVFCHMNEIPDVTKQQRLMDMAVQSQSLHCTVTTKLCQTPPGLDPLDAELMEGSPSGEQPSTSRSRNFAHFPSEGPSRETLTFVWLLLNKAALSPVAPRK